jgi:lipopolysaccharide biosynthesis protein
MLLAPPNVPHRKKEARRWLDELKVRCSNGSVWERRPDHRYISIEASEVLWMASLDELSRTDPELHRAVERVIFENVTRDLGITVDEWRKRSHRRSQRISKLRAEMRRGLV